MCVFVCLCVVGEPFPRPVNRRYMIYLFISLSKIIISCLRGRKNNQKFCAGSVEKTGILKSRHSPSIKNDRDREKERERAERMTQREK